jgi:uncharacterized membrane protein YhiD involved in acid resistance
MVVATNVVLRPLSRLVDRQPSKTEMEVWYLLQIACRKAAEQEVRARLVDTAAEEHLTVRALRSAPGADADSVRLETTLVLHGRAGEIMEPLARRLGAHAGVLSVSWEISGEAHVE